MGSACDARSGGPYDGPECNQLSMLPKQHSHSHCETNFAAETSLVHRSLAAEEIFLPAERIRSSIDSDTGQLTLVLPVLGIHLVSAHCIIEYTHVVKLNDP